LQGTSGVLKDTGQFPVPVLFKFIRNGHAYCLLKNHDSPFPRATKAKDGMLNYFKAPISERTRNRIPKY
jgi:hypothetical protein